MKIDYNILWLDDAKFEIVEGDYHTELKDFITDLGFNPRIEIVRTEKEFFEVLDSIEWDLILTDYNLDEIKDNPEKGDHVIREVRSKNVQTEILFYTKQDDGNREKGFDRITFIDTSKLSGTVHNEKVLEKAKELIKLTVRKFEHIVAMRGMIMHETSELDSQLLEICQKNIDKNSHKKLIEALFDKIISHHVHKFKNGEKFKRNLRIDKLYKDHVMFSFSIKADAVSLLIDDLELENFIDDFKEEIINPRNDFAHAVLDTSNNTFKTKSGLEFNADKCKEIRKAIIKHKGNLQKLIKGLEEKG